MRYAGEWGLGGVLAQEPASSKAPATMQQPIPFDSSKYGTCYDAATHPSIRASSIACSASSMHDTCDLPQCSDPSHSACPRPCTLQELFQQGDRERALGQPISPLMDRTKSGIQKSQTGFFAVVAQPMYTVSGAPVILWRLCGRVVRLRPCGDLRIVLWP